MSEAKAEIESVTKDDSAMFEHVLNSLGWVGLVGVVFGCLILDDMMMILF